MMSRTEVHRPYRAWFNDPSNCVEEHDHTDGPCDLPTLSQWRNWLNGGEVVQPCRCGWALQLERLPRLCGCRLCTGHHWNRIDRRADRHRAQRWLRTGSWVRDWID
jgi:hypothetical protein